MPVRYVRSRVVLRNQPLPSRWLRVPCLCVIVKCCYLFLNILSHWSPVNDYLLRFLSCRVVASVQSVNPALGYGCFIKVASCFIIFHTIQLILLFVYKFVRFCLLSFFNGPRTNYSYCCCWSRCRSRVFCIMGSRNLSH